MRGNGLWEDLHICSVSHPHLFLFSPVKEMYKIGYTVGQARPTWALRNTCLKGVLEYIMESAKDISQGIYIILD